MRPCNEIRDSRGRLVQWTATIESINSEETTINFDYPENPTTVDVLPPRGPLEILGQSLQESFQLSKGNLQ